MSATDPFSVAGQVVIVTGATKGLGRAFATGLAAAGARVVVASRKQQSCAEVADEIRRAGGEAVGLAAHVGRWDELPPFVDAVLAHYGRIDGLVNNAGISPMFCDLTDMTEAYWDKVMSVNVKGPLRLAALVAPHLRAAGGGAIVNVASIGGYRGQPHNAHYAASKAALLNLTQSMAAEWADWGVRVNKASLYHHFTNKEAILVGATELALAEVTAPRNEADSWRVWMPLNAYLLRSALIAHPDLIPIMLRRVSLGIGRAEVEAAVARLRAEGVPEAAVVPLMESLEMVAIVSALQVVGGASIAAGAGEASKYVLYQEARDARGLTDEEQFEVILGSVMSSVESAVALKVAAAAAASPRRRSSPSGRRRSTTSTGRQPVT